MELIYKRWILVLGFGGLIRERVGFVVWDIYFFYYGRICFIEILEGLNVGLIGFLVNYVKVNSYGFIEIFYYLVENGWVLCDCILIYMIVDVEDDLWVVLGDIMIDVEGKILGDVVLVCYW